MCGFMTPTSVYVVIGPRRSAYIRYSFMVLVATRTDTKIELRYMKGAVPKLKTLSIYHYAHRNGWCLDLRPCVIEYNSSQMLHKKARINYEA